MMMPSTTPASPASPASLAAAISLLDLATSDVGADFTLARQRISAARDILLGRGLEQPRLPAGGLAPWQTKRVIAHIEANIEDVISNEGLANLVSLSTGHFTRAFRQTFGITPHVYVTGRRVDLAAAMITQTDEKLAIIAASCGFHDQSHLNRIFRRVKGFTPAAWRRRSIIDAMEPA